MNDKLLIWGGGGHALTVVDAVRAQGRFREFAIMVNQEYSDKIRAALAEYALDPPADLTTLKSAGFTHAIVAIGECAIRLEQSAGLRESGLTMATVIHPTAAVSPSAIVGDGTLIGPNAVVGAGAIIGCDVIVNSGAIVEHECRIGSGAHICPGANLAGNVTVGNGAWVGIGAVVLQTLSIGDSAIIGAGAVVTRSVVAGTVAYGVPARPIRPAI